MADDLDMPDVAPEDDVDELSEADSDYLELQADIARLDASRNAFLKEHLGPNAAASKDSSGTTTTRRRRGPRKAAEPSGEVKLRLQQAHQLFMDHRYEDALEALHEIIRVNAETHAAWTLLASINEDLGRRDDAVMAMLFAAHLEPKHVAGWLSTADYALAGTDEGGTEEERLHNLQIARLCYSGAIRADKDSIPARLGKANICLEFGQATNAATEYVRVLKRRPYALQVLRNLAEASYDSVRGAETIESAIAAYGKAISHLKSMSSPGQPYLLLDDDEVFSWMDVTIYVELYAAVARFDEAIAALKDLARWMLGRQGPNEAYWESNPNDDDCEWDRYDEPRRIRVPGFVPGRYASMFYGDGLPIDLRTKLAIYRLRLGHEEEAMEHLLGWIDPKDPATVDSMGHLYPHLLKDVGSELYAAKRYELALSYLELYRMMNGSDQGMEDDADALVLQGKCNLELHDHSAAEECFLAAIDADDENIDARFELAKMYERAQEKEQAFILVNEALTLEARQQKSHVGGGDHRYQDENGRGGDGDDEHDHDGMGQDIQGNNDQTTKRPRGQPASLETPAYRIFLDGDGKVVRRRRKATLKNGGERTDTGETTAATASPRRTRKRTTGTKKRGAGAATDADGQPTTTEGDEDDEKTGADEDGATRQRRPPPIRRRRFFRGHHARRLFASPAEQIKFEADTSTRLRARYQLCMDAKARAAAADTADYDGDGDSAAAVAAATDEWMEAAKELIDDFRSFREFYPWDKYVAFLGYSKFLQDPNETAAAGGHAVGDTAVAMVHGNRDMTALAERLQQNLAPVEEETSVASVEGRAPSAMPSRRDFRGIPFEDWLSLFLEYALSLAHAGRTEEAYAVCQSAHDSTVYRHHDNAELLIHLTWAACAVRAGDEAACVAVGRYFMRERPGTTDCYRLFTAMCRMCRGYGSSGAVMGTWFSSSPSQKYILRQIKLKDEELLGGAALAKSDAAGDTPGGAGTKHLSKEAAGLDVCLLVVYGHILLASTSYRFALNYYQRAHSVDPGNPAISLFIALSYVHWALKRQAENRQYLLMQGLNYLFQYVRLRLQGDDGKTPVDKETRQETYYNVARTYHLLGLHALAGEFYEKVLAEGDSGWEQTTTEVNTENRKDSYYADLRTEAAYNLRTYYLLAGNTDAAMRIAREYLVM